MVVGSHPFLMRDREARAQLYRQLREERAPDDCQRWILLIKELRVVHDCGIYDAQRIALLDPTWKRWVERQINFDEACARTARSHIRRNGDVAFLVEKDGKLTVR